MADKQSTRGSGAKKGAPKYQNTFAYKHNPKSKKTQTILALPVDGLCRRCTDQVNWRKQYRKYKPLTVAKKCVSCQLKKVKKAYHVLCDDCAGAKGVCAKCAEKAQIIPDSSAAAQQDSAATEQAVEHKLAGMRERERRTYLRRLERGDISVADIMALASDDSGSDLSDSEDSQGEDSDGDDGEGISSDGSGQ